MLLLSFLSFQGDASIGGSGTGLGVTDLGSVGSGVMGAFLSGSGESFQMDWIGFWTGPGG